MTIMSAPFTSFTLQVPTSGKAGGGYSSPEAVFGMQHLKLAGPGHWFDTVLPLHDDVQRQFPLPEHWVLVQHLILSGVPGQALKMNVPSEENHSDVAMQALGALSLPMQGLFQTARSAMALKIAVAVKMERHFILNGVWLGKNTEILIIFKAWLVAQWLLIHC